MAAPSAVLQVSGSKFGLATRVLLIINSRPDTCGVASATLYSFLMFSSELRSRVDEWFTGLGSSRARSSGQETSDDRSASLSQCILTCEFTLNGGAVDLVAVDEVERQPVGEGAAEDVDRESALGPKPLALLELDLPVGQMLGRAQRS